jgi:hypothetical protein
VHKHRRVVAALEHLAATVQARGALVEQHLSINQVTKVDNIERNGARVSL